MRCEVLSVEGKRMKEIELPQLFETPYRPDLVKKGFVISRKNGRLPYGSKPTAGKEYSVEWWGKGRGVARTPRIKGSRRGAFAPNTVGGRRAHPPKAEKAIKRKMNKKEGSLALRSALAATANKEVVRRRGHRFSDEVKLPIVVSDDFSRIDSTKEMVSCLRSLGLAPDIERSEEGRHVRAGKGKIRGRRYRVPRSLLIVSEMEPKGARNLSGVEIVKPSAVAIQELAPGGDPGRLTIYTEGSLKALSQRFGNG
jgi:large subunit ribosomal protein L4e